MKRSPRGKANFFEAEQLLEAWEPLAKKKKPGFRWDGQEYGKERKSQGPDRSGLNKHAEPLMGLLEVAGGCHPRHVAVRNTLELLDAKHDIRPAKCTAHWADAAAGKWTVMAKHAGDLAAKNKDTGMEDLDKLLTLVRKLTRQAEERHASPPKRAGDNGAAGDNAEHGAAAGDNAEHGAAAEDNAEHGGAEPDDSDVDVVGFTCNCPTCQKERAMVDVDAEDARSESSLAAERAVPVDPSKGGHKQFLQGVKAAGSDTQAGDSTQAEASAKAEPSTFEASTGVLPAHIVWRSKPQSGYIMAGKPPKYWIGCTVNQSQNYAQVLESLKKSIEDGSLHGGKIRETDTAEKIMMVPR